MVSTNLNKQEVFASQLCKWSCECPECHTELFDLNEDECISGAIFTHKCSQCGATFNVRAS